MRTDLIRTDEIPAVSMSELVFGQLKTSDITHAFHTRACAASQGPCRCADCPRCGEVLDMAEMAFHECPHPYPEPRGSGFDPSYDE